MNMNQAKALRKNSQSGFTLIELIVVIVILGILAATALPKFANLSADARYASLKAAGGALMSTSAMAHSKYLLNPSAGNVTFEGTTIDINTTSGYPALDNTLAAGAGMAQNPNNTSDYLYLGPGNTGGTTTPTTSATQIAMIPRSVVGTPTASSCAVIYTGATTANSAPTVTYPPDSTSC